MNSYNSRRILLFFAKFFINIIVVVAGYNFIYYERPIYNVNMSIVVYALMILFGTIGSTINFIKIVRKIHGNTNY